MKKTIFTLALILITTCTLSAQALKPGDKAPSFTLNGVDGQSLTLSDYYSQGRGIILVFLCNECPCSEGYESRVIALHKRYAQRGFPVVAINSNDATVSKVETLEGMKQRAKEKSFPFRYLKDEDQEVLRKYGASRTPEVFLLKRINKNELTVIYTGAIDDNRSDPSAVKERFLENAINVSLKNRTPKPAVTSTIGCAIKLKK